MRNVKGLLVGLLASVMLTTVVPAEAETLRLLTWGDYAPEAVIKKFKEATGIDVEVTISNNEDMISKLRATGGAGFDLAQPSQDRILGPQTDFGIYKPIDLSKIKTELFIPELLEATRRTRRSTARSTASRTVGHVGPGGRPQEGTGHQELPRSLQARI